MPPIVGPFEFLAGWPVHLSGSGAHVHQLYFCRMRGCFPAKSVCRHQRNSGGEKGAQQEKCQFLYFYNIFPISVNDQNDGNVRGHKGELSIIA
jgi:hypothetical protein